MQTPTTTSPAPNAGDRAASRDTEGPTGHGALVLWTLAGLTALGVAVRFASLGVQSYHHDEVITAARVIPGSFIHMLREVKASESNPPLYYSLAWAWAKAFGTGEAGLRSLSALFGAATVPVAYLIGRELASRRAGLIAAALAAVNPMLIWYSQEARSYAFLVFFGALGLLFFARALNRRRPRDLGLWALASALALCSHYFAGFAIAAEAVWLLVALPERRRAVLAAIGGVAAIGVALLPLLLWQVNPRHTGWIAHRPLSSRLYETGVSFLSGETGKVIGEPLQARYALIPALLVGAALLLVAMQGSAREKRGAALGIAIAAVVVLLPAIAALFGKDYVLERNLLSALVPLGVAVAIGLAVAGARRIGVVLALVLCVYWLAFDIHVTQTPSLQRPEFRTLARDLGPAHVPRAIVAWILADDPLVFYLEDGAQSMSRGCQPIEEIDIVTRVAGAGRPPGLPRAFHPAGRVRLPRFTLTKYVSTRPRPVWFAALKKLPTGFETNAVVIDGLPSQARLPRWAGLNVGASSVEPSTHCAARASR